MKKTLLLTVGMLAIAMLVIPARPATASLSISLSVGVAPPPIPVYTQPPCPAPGYIWTPGHWAYDPENGYFWVPGTWVMAPAPGLLWTPGYWGWSGVAFIWHLGYWGPHVGFYGGIDYGHGYPGVGFVGGEWRGRDFYYNRAENNFGGRPFAHEYDHPEQHFFSSNHVSYNGGAGGLRARPTGAEIQAEHERHVGATPQQQQHESVAHNDRGQYLSANHGKPEVAGTARPGEFQGSGAMHATRAGGPVSMSQLHASNAGHPGNYSRGANPGGGGTHPDMTAHPNEHPTQSYHGENTRAPARGYQPQAHHPETHSAQMHQPQGYRPQAHQSAARPPAGHPRPQEHNSHAPAGGHKEPHGQEPHR